MQFEEGMKKLHTLAGHSQEQLDEIRQGILNMASETGVNPLSTLGYTSLSRELKIELQARVKHEEEVLRVMTVLPGKHRYEQVETAINASGIAPRYIYECLAANNNTVALARFYEALNGSGSTQE